MQTANVLVSLGGDKGNTVMKYGVTAAEIAVLMAIHGNDAVADVEPIGDVKRSHRDERGRLLAIYGGATDPTQKPIVEGLFPGAAARVFETIDELGLDESMFKATGRMTAAPSSESTEEAFDPGAALALDRVGSFDESADDGVGDDMPDANEFKEPNNILG